MNNHPYRDRLLEILDKGRADDTVSKICDYFLSILIILNLVSICLESIDSIDFAYGHLFYIFEIFSLVIFTTEYFLRIWVAASNSEVANSILERRLKYIFSLTGLIDLIAILPGILQFIGVGLDLRWLRIMRLIRLLKISHYTSAFDDLFEVLIEERKPLAATLYLLLVAIFFSSSCLYLIEGDVQSAFVSIPESMWWSVVTLTTVGYGDVSPITPLGKFIGALTSIIGVLTVAMMTGIVSSAFTSKLSSKREALRYEIAEALDDGIISGEEMEEIESIARSMNLSSKELQIFLNYQIRKLKDKET
ncbi:ion transporter [Gammaproteobacteria bacterium]|nr:ion transporter [Gammaproteobacteria bacterium]